MRKEAEPKTPFGHRLRGARKAYGLRNHNPEITAKDFAELLHMEAQTYRRWELGETEPNLDALVKIHKLTKISLDTLIVGDGVKIPVPSRLKAYTG